MATEEYQLSNSATQINTTLSKMGSVSATATELNYVKGCTSNIQTQIDTKADKSYVDEELTNFVAKDVEDLTNYTNNTSLATLLAQKQNALTEGQTVPIGGVTGQVLAKKTNSDYDIEWVNQTGGGGSSASASLPSFVADVIPFPNHGDIITAPDDGYYYFNRFTGSAGQYLQLVALTEDETAAYSKFEQPYNKQLMAVIMFPVVKGCKVKVNTNLTGEVLNSTFIYAVGALK